MSDVMGQHQADLSKIETDGLIDLTDLSAKRANAQMTQHSQIGYLLFNAQSAVQVESRLNRKM